jgi:hypothetical protein
MIIYDDNFLEKPGFLFVVCVRKKNQLNFFVFDKVKDGR